MNRGPKPRKFQVLRRALDYLRLLKEMQRSLLVLVKVGERTCILREAEMEGRSNHHQRLIKHKKISFLNYCPEYATLFAISSLMLFFYDFQVE